MKAMSDYFFLPAEYGAFREQARTQINRLVEFEFNENTIIFYFMKMLAMVNLRT